MKNIQTILLNIGKDGCLCLCYYQMAGLNPVQFIFDYERLVEKGIINKDCFVNDGEALLLFATGKKWKVIREKKSNPEYIVDIGGHFLIVNDKDEVVYDSLGKYTGKVKPKSYRFITN